MNERGLAVALMWHDEGDVGLDGTYSRLSELQWIQYQLDNFQNIAEVVQGLDTIRIQYFRDRLLGQDLINLFHHPL